MTDPMQMTALQQEESWRAAVGKLAEDGRRRVALYGAGRHADRFLAAMSGSAPVRFVLALDESPDPPAEIRGLPVIHPRELSPADADAVLICSDQYEASMWIKARRSLADAVPVYCIYDSIDSVNEGEFSSYRRFLYPNSEVGMTTASERALLHWYAAVKYTGAGALVDLGSWLGSTVAALARGLADNPRAGDDGRRLTVHAFDLFRWQELMEVSDTVRALNLHRNYRPGDSFLDEFERQTARWRDLIEVHPGDLNTVGWHGGPIEFIHIDAMKTLEVAGSIQRDFFPHLIPGIGYIAHQDYAHYHAAWIHPLMYRLRDYFEPAYALPSSDTVVFRLVDEIPGALVSRRPTFAEFSDSEIDAAFEYSAGVVRKEKRPCISAAKVMWHVHAGRPDAAVRLFDALESEIEPCEHCHRHLSEAVAPCR